MGESQPWYDKNVQTSKWNMSISEREWRKSRHVDDYMLFSAKRSNYMKVLRKAKVDNFNFIIKENENDQRVI